MKKIVSSLFVVLCYALAVVSCSMELSINEPQLEEGFAVTINAGNPEAMPASKTEMEGVDTFWSVGDKIGVSNGTDSNVPFTTDIAAKSATAAFTGTLAVGDYYAYYPYSSNGVGSSGGDEKGAKVDLPANQNPTATSFDGSADILVSKQFNVAAANPTIDDLEFARLVSVVKIVLIDIEGVMTTTQCPSFVSMTAATNLAGRVLVNMKDQVLEEPYYNQSKTVTANYTEETKYVINGTNATYLVVVPQTLEAGSILTIAASTPGYSISKEITVPAGGIELAAGKITTLKINLSSANISTDAGAALPFNDNMAWANNGSTDGTTDIGASISSAEYSNGLYTTGTKAYKGKGGLKLGTSSASGSITTKQLDLSGAFHIVIEGGKYGSDTGTLEVSVDKAKVITGEAIAGVNFVNIPAGTYTNKSTVTIATSAKRGYIYSVTIASGEYVAPPVINVTSDNPMAVTKDNDLYAIEYNISNPTGASISAVADVDWIHDFDYSTPGEVSFEVDAQEADAAVRSGVITLSYAGAANVDVTVNQEAGPSSGGPKVHTATINFGSAAGSTQIKGASSSGSGTVTYTDSGNDSEGNTWTVTTVTSKSKSFTQQSTYSQVGSSSNAVTSITFTTTLSESATDITLQAKFGGFSSTAGTVTLKVGDSSIGSGSLSGTSDVTVNSTSTGSGTVLTVTVTGIAKGVKCYYLKATYTN